MADGKVVTLTAMPQLAATLSVPVHGVVENVPAVLGQQVHAYSLDDLYGDLPTPTKADPAVLTYNSAGIMTAVAGSVLLNLRGERAAAALDAAVAARANAYYGGLGNPTAALAAQVEAWHGSGAGSKQDSLRNLLTFADIARVNLDKAYQGQPAIVEGTTEVTTQPGYANTPYTISSEFHDHIFRTPGNDAIAALIRAKVTLQDQLITELLKWQNATHFKEVSANQLTVVDQQVRIRQLALLETIVLSPIDGMVTAVLASPGDRVVAGQPLLRVESDAKIYLVGTIVYRGFIAAGTATAKVTTTSALGVPGNQLEFDGTVVAARGNATGEDRWDVVIAVNPPDGKLPFGSKNQGFASAYGIPLHYTFGTDDTTVAIA